MNILNNWKTTALGIITMLAFVVKALFGIEVSVEVQTGFVTVVVFLIGLFAKDADKTGTAARPPP
jgi:hypothetical protein